MDNLAVRDATVDDIPSIYALLDDYAAEGVLLPRAVTELYRDVREFVVIEENGELVGCASLEVFTRELGEVRSLAVHRAHSGRGIGRLIVERIMQNARQLGLTRVMALTYVPGFFHSMGFETVSKDVLPEKVWGVCVKCAKFNDCDEIPVLINFEAA